MYRQRALLHTVKATIFILLTALLIACSESSAPVVGFYLPQGDVERGKQVFINYQCHECHSLAETELPPASSDTGLMLEIGGEVHTVVDYGKLLTSIVKPDHIVSRKYRAMLDKEERETAQSPMPNFNEKLTVAELIDLVMFLHTQYELTMPQYRGYYYYQ
jgi:mono/diheme cytochrome c family protein